MDTHYVRAVFDLECIWDGPVPNYRIYVNNELFTERTWRWTDCYLQEILQIQACPGRYTVRLEPVAPCHAEFRMSCHDIELGPAAWADINTIEIHKP